MNLWVVLECGFDDGSVEVVATFKTYKEANKLLKKMMDERDEEDRDWLWYDMKQIIAPI